MVATSDQCGTCGRAERSGVELRVAQPRLGDTLQCGSWDDASEGARNTVALVIGHDEEDVRRALGRHDPRRPKRLGVQSAFLDQTPELFGRCRNLFTIDRYRGTGVTRCAGELLGLGGRRKRRDGGSDHPGQEDVFDRLHRRLTWLNLNAAADLRTVDDRPLARFLRSIQVKRRHSFTRFSDLACDSAIGPKSYGEVRSREPAYARLARAFHNRINQSQAAGGRLVCNLWESFATTLLFFRRRLAAARDREGVLLLFRSERFFLS